MEWLKELLKNAGIEESKIDSIVTDFNKEVPKYLIPKDKYNELAETKKRLEADLSERDQQLEDLSKSAGLTEELKTQIEQLKQENQAAKEQYEKELQDLTLSSAIKSAISGKVHDEELVLSLFDREKLVIDGDKIVGLDEQLKELQESKSFLFKSEEQSGFKIGGNGQGAAQASEDQLASIFGNTE